MTEVRWLAELLVLVNDQVAESPSSSLVVEKDSKNACKQRIFQTTSI